MNIRDLKIALVLGGTSPERNVSKSTAESIYKALMSLGCKPLLIDPAYGINQPKDFNTYFIHQDIGDISNSNYVRAVNSKLFDQIDIAVLALHGKWGEDGTIQSLLELRGIKYTGSKVLASALAMDKIMSKILFQHYNVNTPKWVTIGNHNNDYSLIIEQIKNELGFPCVVKPNDQGSTVGVTICKDESQLSAAFDLAKSYSNRILAEEFIAGHEVTVAILDNQPLPVLEIKPKHNVYDYECKYTSGMSEYEVPAKIPEEVAKKIRDEALAAHLSLGCEVYSRVDFRLSNEMVPYCLEVNTLPGMTSTSLVPKMAKAVDITFEELIEKIIQLSL
ncbi:MAG: D-alanine--D-alanine ligase [Ignavibacteriaceae bacterium]|nr:D-alanine--D-alanine ligase [Ignavibacteriaceae bacterium]